MNSAWLIPSLGLFAFLGTAGCGTPSFTHSELSAIDAQYLKGEPNVPQGALTVRIYRRSLNAILGAHCRYLPSDSEFYLRTERSCGTVRASLFTIARMMNEQDAGHLGYPIVQQASSLSFFAPTPLCAEP